MIFVIHVDKFAEVIDIVLGHISLLLHGDKQDRERIKDHLLALRLMDLILELAIQVLSLLLPVEDLTANSVKESHCILCKLICFLHRDS